jgi:transposase
VRDIVDENTRLKAELAEQKAALERLHAEREQLLKKVASLLRDVELLRRQLYGRKSEKVSDAQLELALLPVLEALGRLEQGDLSAADDAEEAIAAVRDQLEPAPTPPEKPTKKPARRKLTELDLPVLDVILEPPERLADGGELLEKIGEDVAEHFERKPASMVRVRVVRPKYKAPSPASDGSTSVAVAEVPERPLPKSLAGPGLLAHVLVSKYADHIPLHRQESIFKREGVVLARSTLSGWVQGSVELLRHIVDAMWEDAKRAPVAIADATGVLVQARDECKRCHFYVVVTPQQHVLFRFTKKNDGDSVASLLSGFSRLHVDASAVYHELFRRDPSVVEVGCWAHARRKFFEALSADRDAAMFGIGMIGLLYDAHDAARGGDGVVDAHKRAKAARPLLARLFAWARVEHRFRKDGDPMKTAVGYLVRQRRVLTRFLDDGALRLDTNPAELELRREVVGRKNWLFVGNDGAAEWNTVAVSLIASCQMHGVEPWAYLRDVLTLLPVWSQTRVLELAPKSWVKTREQPETQRLLDELDLLRRAVPHVEEDAADPAPAS